MNLESTLLDENASWVLEWFERRQALPVGAAEDRLRIDFFQGGILDSFGAVELVADLESRFDIHLTPEHFQDRRFSTLGGLAQIIGELRTGSAYQECT